MSDSKELAVEGVDYLDVSDLWNKREVAHYEGNSPAMKTGEMVAPTDCEVHQESDSSDVDLSKGRQVVEENSKRQSESRMQQAENTEQGENIKLMMNSSDKESTVYFCQRGEYVKINMTNNLNGNSPSSRKWDSYWILIPVPVKAIALLALAIGLLAIATGLAFLIWYWFDQRERTPVFQNVTTPTSNETWPNSIASVEEAVAANETMTTVKSVICDGFIKKKSIYASFC
jgi:hypothetical protein